MTPFEEFFATVWQPYIDRLATYDSGPVFTGGRTINGASWDRKAAFLLWLIIQGKSPP